jgi:hypothetical protein
MDDAIFGDERETVLVKHPDDPRYKAYYAAYTEVAGRPVGDNTTAMRMWPSLTRKQQDTIWAVYKLLFD